MADIIAPYQSYIGLRVCRLICGDKKAFDMIFE